MSTELQELPLNDLSVDDPENNQLEEVLRSVVLLRSKYDGVQLSKDISILKSATRIQGIPFEDKRGLFRELKKRTLIKQILDGDMQ